jgi:hypothetical protein
MNALDESQREAMVEIVEAVRSQGPQVDVLLERFVAVADIAAMFALRAALLESVVSG